MARSRGVSSKTHTQKQLDDYANQNNPNNKAYKARKANEKSAKKVDSKKQAKSYAKLQGKTGVFEPLDWFCYGNPYDFD